MGRRWAVSLAVVVMVASMTLVGVGPAGAVTLTQLRADALSVRRMPTGWFAHAPAQDPRLGCLTGLLEPTSVKETYCLEVYYVAKNDLPFVVETLTTYASASSAFTRIAAAIARCRSISGVMDGYRVTGTVRSVTLGRFANASVVDAITVKGTRYTVPSYYAIFRKGTMIAAVLETNCPAVSVSQFLGFVRAAVAKISSRRRRTAVASARVTPAREKPSWERARRARGGKGLYSLSGRRRRRDNGSGGGSREREPGLGRRVGAGRLLQRSDVSAVIQSSGREVARGSVA